MANREWRVDKTEPSAQADASTEVVQTLPGHWPSTGFVLVLRHDGVFHHRGPLSAERGAVRRGTQSDTEVGVDEGQGADASHCTDAGCRMPGAFPLSAPRVPDARCPVPSALEGRSCAAITPFRDALGPSGEPLRPQGATGCSHGCSERVFERAQPVDPGARLHPSPGGAAEGVYTEDAEQRRGGQGKELSRGARGGRGVGAERVN